VREREAPRVEEDEIARREVAESNAIADLRELARSTRQRNAGNLLEDVLDQAAAVESLVRIHAAVSIANAYQTERERAQVLRTAPCARRYLRSRRLCRRNPRRALALSRV